MQFLYNFGKPWWLRISKTFNKEQIGCRGDFFQEIKAIGVEKMHQFRPKLTKIQKKSIFLKKFMQFSCNSGKPW